MAYGLLCLNTNSKKTWKHCCVKIACFFLTGQPRGTLLQAESLLPGFSQVAKIQYSTVFSNLVNLPLPVGG